MMTQTFTEETYGAIQKVFEKILNQNGIDYNDPLVKRFYWLMAQSEAKIV